MTGSNLIYPHDTLPLAVCGLHMRGYPLERQLLAHDAHFLREAQTAPLYRLYRLPTAPPKPGLVRVTAGGVSVAVELWEIPTDRFGSFAAMIPSPLGIGKITLADGGEVCGFLCEPFVLPQAEDVSRFGGWRRCCPPDHS